MNAILASCIDTIEIRNSFIHGRMEIVPIFSSLPEGPEYLTLGEALEGNLITITEVSEGGSVPNLNVTNRAKIPVLLIDGEELAGAKQNRVLNTSILVPPGADLTIPVSCTEMGRWSYKSRDFSDSEVMMDYKIRQKKMASVACSLRSCASHRADQGQIWSDIDYMSEKAGVRSPTMAMKDVFDMQKERMDEYSGAFPIQPGQQGVLVYIDNTVAGFEMLSRPGAYARIHEKLIRSYAMEASFDDEPSMKNAPVPEKPSEFLKRLASCKDECYPSPGLGLDFRLKGPGILGSALFHENMAVHMACFTEDTRAPESDSGHMAGYRTRRDSRRSTRGEPLPGYVKFEE